MYISRRKSSTCPHFLEWNRISIAFVASPAPQTSPNTLHRLAHAFEKGDECHSHSVWRSAIEWQCVCVCVDTAPIENMKSHAWGEGPPSESANEHSVPCFRYLNIVQNSTGWCSLIINFISFVHIIVEYLRCTWSSFSPPRKISHSEWSALVLSSEFSSLDVGFNCPWYFLQ